MTFTKNYHSHRAAKVQAGDQPCGPSRMSNHHPSGRLPVQQGSWALGSDLPSDVESDCPVPVPPRPSFFTPGQHHPLPNIPQVQPQFPYPQQALDEDPEIQHRALNTPISNERDRLKTFAAWCNPFVTAEDLARDGFTYTGVADRVQCTFCRCVLSGWTPGDIVSNEHRRHFPKCPFVMGLPVGNIPIPRQTSNFAYVPHDTTALASPSYDLAPHPASAVASPGTLGPRFPDFAIEAHRLDSFQNWPAQLNQKPADLAKAGLFYEGQGDRCKCFQCGGVLHDWEAEDEAWTEHARWFQDCSFVKLAKGEEFIQRAVRGEGYCAQATSTTPENDIWNHSAVLAVLQNGYSKESVQRALERHGPHFKDNQELYREVIAADQELKMLKCSRSNEESGMEVEEITTGANTESHQTNPKTVSPRPNEAGGSRSPKPVTETKQTEAKKTDNKTSSKKSNDNAASSSTEDKDDDERTCKICLDEEIGVVFVPCGHLCCCAGCSAPLQECPICRAPIEKKVKTYWA